jgi:hypothetical protein
MHSPGLDDSDPLRRAHVRANAFAIFSRGPARALFRSPGSPCVYGLPKRSARLVAIRIGGYERKSPKLFPRLPGLVPVRDTAA